MLGRPRLGAVPIAAGLCQIGTTPYPKNAYHNLRLHEPSLKWLQNFEHNSVPSPTFDCALF